MTLERVTTTTVSIDDIAQNRSPVALWWILTNIIGGAIAGIMALQFQFLGDLVLTGVIIGIAQWLVLRLYLRNTQALAWLIASVLGWVVANWITSSLLGGVLDPLIHTLTSSGIFWEVFWINVVKTPVMLALWSIPQAAILMQRSLSGILWIPVSIIGGLLMGAAGVSLCSA
ncbi:MAG: hypothetical protein AAF639_45425, partial [Chloroflexota bacterium]